MSKKENNKNEVSQAGNQNSQSEEFQAAVKKAVEEVKKEEKAKEQKKSDRINKGLGSRSDLYSKSFRGRYWAFIVYLEMLDFVIEEIIKRGLRVAISPVHDKDIKNPDTGELDKEHCHVLVDFGRRYCESSVLCLLSGLAANNFVVPVADPEAYHRYLWHGDNPEKASYRECDVSYYGGFEKNNLPSCRLSASMELAEIIIDNHFTSYRSLVSFVLKANRTDLYQLLMSNTNHFRALVISQREDIKDVSEKVAIKKAGSYSFRFVVCDDGRVIIDDESR